MVRSSLKFACTCGAEARRSRILTSSSLISAPVSVCAGAASVCARRTRTAAQDCLFIALIFAPRLGFSRSRSRQSEENCGDERPEDADTAGDSKAAERWIARESERTETGDGGKPRQQHWFHHSCHVVFELLRFLPYE